MAELALASDVGEEDILDLGSGERTVEDFNLIDEAVKESAVREARPNADV